jgi:hypothetical protein
MRYKIAQQFLLRALERLQFRQGGERRMCHSQRWQEWERLMDEERREDEEPRVIEVATEPETVEPEPESDPERELVHA